MPHTWRYKGLSVSDTTHRILYRRVEAGKLYSGGDLIWEKARDWWSFSDGLLDIYCVGDMPKFHGTRPWSRYWGEIEKIRLEASVTSIENDGWSVFNDLPSLSIIYFEGVLTLIPASTFRGCTMLRSVTLPDGLLFIQAFAFKDCKRLQSVSIPASVRSILNQAFQNTALTAVTINRSCYVASGAFPSGCTIQYY